MKSTAKRIGKQGLLAFRLTVPLIVCVGVWALVLVLLQLRLALVMPVTILVVGVLEIAVIYLVFFRKPKKAGTKDRRLLRVENVPELSALVLRYHLAGTGGDEVDIRNDTTNYICMTSGFVVYSPWFYTREGIVDLSRIVLPQDGITVNSTDGLRLKVDCKVIASVVDPILFLINVRGTKDVSTDMLRAQLTKEVTGFANEYLETALQRVTSVEADPSKPDTTWESDAMSLSRATDKVQKAMSKYVTNWITERIVVNDRGSEAPATLGFRLDVEINSFDLPPTLQRAMESKASAKAEAEAEVIKAGGLAESLTTLITALDATNPVSNDELKAVAMQAFGPEADPEIGKMVMEVMGKQLDGKKWMALAAILPPAIIDAMQLIGKADKPKDNAGGDKEKAAEPAKTK